MTLAFSTKINGKPTFFVQKIIIGLHKLYPRGFEIGRRFDYAPKIHTIREDAKDRWKVGNKIHFTINNRTKNRFQFAPVINVVSIQRIDIYVSLKIVDIVKKSFALSHEVYVDDRKLNDFELEQLAKNDGFDSIEDFKAWFNVDLRGGKIIHWTDIKY